MPHATGPLASPLETHELPPVLRLGPYSFKAAVDDDELEQVHRLNYQTFVREIPQHADPGGGRLVDKFHEKNVYLVAKRERRVVGMVSAHDQPPFSVAEKLPDPALLEGLGDRILEVRLLAIGRAERSSMVFAGLGFILHRYAQLNGYTHLVISGIADRERMYGRLGFKALAPAVRSGEASFIPMAMEVGRALTLTGLVDRFEERIKNRPRRRSVARFTPGPVQISTHVGRAFRSPPIGHRSSPFIETFEEIRRRLCEMTGGSSRVALMSGSGTLGNDAIAAALAADPATGPGLILVNGEFGERLTRQAARAGLAFQTLAWDWGKPWDLDAVAGKLGKGKKVDWVWGVHLESSTGVLNDLPGLVRLARRNGSRVCLDCVSSLGAVPFDLTGVYLASSASGKSLGSYAGLSILFADPLVLQRVKKEDVAPSLDLVSAIECHGPRFTFSSPQVMSLREALAVYETATGRRKRYDRYERLGRMVRAGLRQAGIEPMAPETIAAPVITTFVCPKSMTSARFVARCRSWGFEVAGLSEYLERRGWAQIATMGDVRPSDVGRLMSHLAEWTNR
ncbi:MAG: aminotransferase class V-fold PLP-dependent enzyme [Phycisphaerales bacterium]